MHPPVGPAWLVWLETSALAEAMRQWTWLYPLVEIVHIVGFVILVGAAFMFDLRLLGVSRGLPVTAMERHLLRAARLSVAIVVPTGILMFVAHATEMVDNPAFRLKVGFLAAALLNAAVFHRVPFRSVAAWDRNAAEPLGARLVAVLSVLLWVSVIACGRLIAYF
jgi:Family of unknown function (DUF6644)